MRDYLLQLLFMVLGATLPILFRALYHAGSRFSLVTFLVENRIRFYIEFVAMLVIQTLLFFEGEAIIEALKSFGVIVPLFSSSALGFGISVLVIKTIPTDKD